MRKLLLILPFLFLIDGCAALGKVNQVFSAQKNPIVQAGITLAVATAIGNGADQATKAAQIKSIASQILVDSSAPAATIALLEASLNTAIAKAVPNPGQRAAFIALSSVLESYLTGYIQQNPTGAITSQTLVDIQGVARAVILATSYYGV